VNPTQWPSDSYFEIEMDHEMGYAGYGLGDCPGCDTLATIMATPPTMSADLGPSRCDQQFLFLYSNGAYGLNPLPCQPVGSPPYGMCSPYWDTTLCQWRSYCSPIIIDTNADGFHLTSPAEGVLFDLAGDQYPVQTAWTASWSENAFLGLDRDDNGRIDNGTELFGNVTTQPASSNANGFSALAVFDSPEYGGNSDGVIDARDAVFAKLRLWIDQNHNGVSERDELFTLSELGVLSIELKYQEHKWKDAFGNIFRYRARVHWADERRGGEGGRWAYDVFLVVTEPETSEISLPEVPRGCSPMLSIISDHNSDHNLSELGGALTPVVK
jgi:hypothetical protein